MAENSLDTQNILSTCEDTGLTMKYGEKNVELHFYEDNIYVISDLHIAEGRNRTGNYSGTENFYYDSSINNFIQFLLKSSNKSVLIINGDFIDFLRITSYPTKKEDFSEWKNSLACLGINKTIDELEKSISPKEIKYGLKTNDFKSVWKLNTAWKGHPEIFEALSDWLNNNNKLIILKGNHDLEIYWLAVRNFFRYIFAEIISQKTNQNQNAILQEKIFPNLIFIDNACTINQDFYVEHGHNYDKFSTNIGNPLINKEELNIPFGSFFNRYLINHIELVYPYIDNVRPRENILPLLLRQHFFLGLRVLFQHVPFLFRIIPKKYYRYMFGRVLIIALAVSIPVILVIIRLWGIIEPVFTNAITAKKTNGIWAYLLQSSTSIVSNFGMLFLSYIFARIVAYFQLEEPSSLTEFGKRKFEENPLYSIITYGHTHNPDQYNDNNRWFFNTGTWIPIVEISSAEIRFDRTFTYLQLTKDSSGKYQPDNLLRWNDDAGRPEKLVIIEKKDGK